MSTSHTDEKVFLGWPVSLVRLGVVSFVVYLLMNKLGHFLEELGNMAGVRGVGLNDGMFVL